MPNPKAATPAKACGDQRQIDDGYGVDVECPGFTKR